MFLQDISLESLDDLTDPNRWGVKTLRDRFIYRDSNYYYKIWGASYIKETVASVSGSFVSISGLNLPHGFEVGLFNSEHCSAFVDHIYDQDGIVRGYVTKVGDAVSFLDHSFVDSFFQSCINCGWLFSDLKRENVVWVDGHLSIIDFDTHLTSVNQFDVLFESTTGSLREHVDLRYRKLIMDYLKFADQS